MKTVKLLCAIALAATVLTACGGKSKSDSEGQTEYMKPETTEVGGDLGECFTVVDKEYKITGEFPRIITVELERTDEELPFDVKNSTIYSYSTFSSSSYIQVGFGIEFLDDDDNVLDKVSASGSGLSGSYSPDEAVDLVKLKPGSKGNIRFSVESEADTATKFRITSSYTIGGSDSDDDVVADYGDDNEASNLAEAGKIDENDDYGSEPSAKSKGSSNWDSVLDQYEKFVTKYADFYKKVKNGTIDVTSPEYIEYVTEATEYSSKLGDAKGDMTTAQWARYMRITQKLNAALR